MKFQRFILIFKLAIKTILEVPLSSRRYILNYFLCGLNKLGINKLYHYLISRKYGPLKEAEDAKNPIFQTVIRRQLIRDDVAVQRRRNLRAEAIAPHPRLDVQNTGVEYAH